MQTASLEQDSELFSEFNTGGERLTKCLDDGSMQYTLFVNVDLVV